MMNADILPSISLGTRALRRKISNVPSSIDPSIDIEQTDQLCIGAISLVDANGGGEGGGAIAQRKFQYIC